MNTGNRRPSNLPFWPLENLHIPTYCTAQQQSRQPNPPKASRLQERCHLICKQRQWNCPIYDGFWNGIQLNKKLFPVERFQISILEWGSTDKRGRKEFATRNKFSSIKNCLILRHNPPIFQGLIMCFCYCAPPFERKNHVLKCSFGH